MSTNTVTLDSLRVAADAKYGSYDIVLSDPTNPVRLLNPFRLSKTKRDELLALQEELSAVTESDTDVDQEELLRRMVLTVAETESAGQALVNAIGDDLAVLASVIEGYSEGTQVGEASASAA